MWNAVLKCTEILMRKCINLMYALDQLYDIVYITLMCVHLQPNVALWCNSARNKCSSLTWSPLYWRVDPKAFRTKHRPYWLVLMIASVQKIRDGNTFWKHKSDPSIKSIVFTMKPTLYNLLQQHGATSDFNKIAALIGDNEAIIVNSIQVGLAFWLVDEIWPLIGWNDNFFVERRLAPSGENIGRRERWDTLL